MADENKSREVYEEMDEGTNVGELTVKVTADVGEAITGFKALQRELRATTKAARELEQAYEDLKDAHFTDEDARRLAGTVVDLADACANCGGSGFVSIGEGIRGVKK